MITRFFLFFFSFIAFTAFASYDVVGIGAPIIDFSIPLNEEELLKVSGKTGGSVVVDWETFKSIRDLGNDRPISINAGGSASNTIRALSNLGKKCAIIGKIGNDEMGKIYLEKISSLGIDLRFTTSNTPTGQVICLITPSGERTLRAFPGASTELRGDELSLDQFEEAKIVHIEGYTLYNDQLAENAMKLAKQKGCLVSFDLGSHEIAAKYREHIISLLKEYVDIAFANEDEIKNLTNCTQLEEGCYQLQQMVPIGIVLNGKNGCYVGHQNHIFHCPTFEAKAIDSTGAGDFFASGFLYGVLHNCPIRDCARLGNLLGSTVVEHVGATLPEEKWDQIRVLISN